MNAAVAALTLEGATHRFISFKLEYSMKSMTKPLLGVIAVLLAASAIPAHAAIKITEVSAWGSGNAPYSTDWFELTNTGASAVSIAGWRMDDNSNSFGSSVAMTGITSIAAGESVIFTETAATASFLSTWFGSHVPTGLQIGNYTGSGVGLSTSGDAVNIYTAYMVVPGKARFGGVKFQGVCSLTAGLFVQACSPAGPDGNRESGSHLAHVLKVRAV